MRRVANLFTFSSKDFVPCLSAFFNRYQIDPPHSKDGFLITQLCTLK